MCVLKCECVNVNVRVKGYSKLLVNWEFKCSLLLRNDLVFCFLQSVSSSTLTCSFGSCCCACACSTNMEGHHAFNLARGYDEIMKLFGRKFKRFELPDEDEYV